MNPTIIKTNSGLEHLDTIISNIQSLIDNKQDFIGFVVIALGIEFIGCFYDGNDLNDFGQSEKRFGCAKYYDKGDKLYIAAYHPAQTTVTRDCYVNNMIDIVKNWVYRKPVNTEIK